MVNPPPRTTDLDANQLPSTPPCSSQPRSRTHRSKKSKPPPPPQHNIQQLLLALCSATLSRLKLYAHRVHGILICPLFRLPGVALGLTRALWRSLLRSWVGQTFIACIAFCTSSIRCSFSCSLMRSSRQALEAGQTRLGMDANVGYAVSLLWGCFRLKSQVELHLARPDFAAAFRRSLQCQRLQIELEQQHQHYQQQQHQLRSSTGNGPASDSHGPSQRLMLPDQAQPGGDLTVLCSQEMTATILSFLRRQQAGARGGAFWAESPRTANSEDGTPSSSSPGAERGVHGSSASSCARHAGGVSITFSSSPATRTSHPVPCKRLSCSSSSPATNYDQSAESSVPAPAAAGSDQQPSHDNSARTPMSGSPVWHANACCVTTPAAPEARGPASADAASITADAAVPVLPLKIAAPGYAYQAGNSAVAWRCKSQPAPSSQVQQGGQSRVGVAADLEPDHRQSGLDQTGLVHAADLDADVMGSFEGSGDRLSGKYETNHCRQQQPQQQQQHMATNHMQHQLYADKELLPRSGESLQGPQPGGESPVKQRQPSRGQRSRMWDMQSSGGSSTAWPWRAASASVEASGCRSNGASVRSSRTGVDSGHVRRSVASSAEGGVVGGPAQRWAQRARLNSSSDSAAAWSIKPFGTSEGGQAGVGSSAALRFAQRLAQETGATDGQAPPPAFLLPHTPPAAPGVASRMTPAAASPPYSAASLQSQSFQQSQSIQQPQSCQQSYCSSSHPIVLGGLDSKRSSSGSTAGPQSKAARTSWDGGAAEGDGEATNSTTSSSTTSNTSSSSSGCDEGTFGSAREESSMGNGCSEASSTGSAHTKSGAAAAAPAAATAAAAAHAYKVSGVGSRWWAATGEERISSSRSRGRSRSGQLGERAGFERVPVPTPACGGASALEQCLQSGSGVTSRAGAAETAAASAVVRAARRSSSSSSTRPSAHNPTPPLPPPHSATPTPPLRHSATRSAADPQEPILPLTSSSSSSSSTSSSADATSEHQVSTESPTSLALPLTPHAPSKAPAAAEADSKDGSAVLSAPSRAPAAGAATADDKDGNTVFSTLSKASVAAAAAAAPRSPAAKSAGGKVSAMSPADGGTLGFAVQRNGQEHQGSHSHAACLQLLGRPAKERKASSVNHAARGMESASLSPTDSIQAGRGSPVAGSKPNSVSPTNAGMEAASLSPVDGGQAGPGSPAEWSKPDSVSPANTGKEAVALSPATWSLKSPWLRKRTEPSACTSTCPPGSKEGGVKGVSGSAARSVGSLAYSARAVGSPAASARPVGSSVATARRSGSPSASTDRDSWLTSPSTGASGAWTSTAGSPAASARAVGSPAASAEGSCSSRKVGAPVATSPARLPAPMDFPLSLWGLGQVFDAGL